MKDPSIALHITFTASFFVLFFFCSLVVTLVVPVGARRIKRVTLLIDTDN